MIEQMSYDFDRLAKQVDSEDSDDEKAILRQRIDLLMSQLYTNPLTESMKGLLSSAEAVEGPSFALKLIRNHYRQDVVKEHEIKEYLAGIVASRKKGNKFSQNEVFVKLLHYVEKLETTHQVEKQIGILRQLIVVKENELKVANVSYAPNPAQRLGSVGRLGRDPLTMPRNSLRVHSVQRLSSVLRTSYVPTRISVGPSLIKPYTTFSPVASIRRSPIRHSPVNVSPIRMSPVRLSVSPRAII